VALIGPYLAACALLVAAGIAKVVRPDDTARAFAGMLGAPFGPFRRALRAGAATEAVLGVAGIAVLWSDTEVAAAVVASLVAASYAAFAVVVLAVRRRGGPLATCGCFGRPETPATLLHVLVDLGLSASAAGVALAVSSTVHAGGVGSIRAYVTVHPVVGALVVSTSAVTAWLVYLTISVFSELEGARRMLRIDR
jgi:Methylamine utilisation protein MauE